MQHPDQNHDMIQDRMTRIRLQAERRRLASRVAQHTSLRSRIARTLFHIAFAVEAEEVWRAMWEKLANGTRARREVGG